MSFCVCIIDACPLIWKTTHITIEDIVKDWEKNDKNNMLDHCILSERSENDQNALKLWICQYKIYLSFCWSSMWFQEFFGTIFSLVSTLKIFKKFCEITHGQKSVCDFKKHSTPILWCSND